MIPVEVLQKQLTDLLVSAKKLDSDSGEGLQIYHEIFQIFTQRADAVFSLLTSNESSFLVEDVLPALFVNEQFMREYGTALLTQLGNHINLFFFNSPREEIQKFPQIGYLIQQLLSVIQLRTPSLGVHALSIILDRFPIEVGPQVTLRLATLSSEDSNFPASEFLKMAFRIALEKLITEKRAHQFSM